MIVVRAQTSRVARRRRRREVRRGAAGEGTVLLSGWGWNGRRRRGTVKEHSQRMDPLEDVGSSLEGDPVVVFQARDVKQHPAVVHEPCAFGEANVPA